MKTATKETADDGRIAARIPVDLKKQVEALAKRQERSVSFLVKKALKRIIAEAEKGNPFNNPTHQPAGDMELAA